MLPHSLLGSPAAAAAVAGPAAAALPASSSGDDVGAPGPAAPNGKDGSASKRPPLHPGPASRAPSPGVAGGGGAPRGVPRQRSVPDIPQHEEVEKQQPGVTAQPDDARLLGSPLLQPAAATAEGSVAAAAAAAADDANLWRTLLEEQLRCWPSRVGVGVAVAVAVAVAAVLGRARRNGKPSLRSHASLAAQH